MSPAKKAAEAPRLTPREAAARNQEAVEALSSAGLLTAAPPANPVHLGRVEAPNPLEGAYLASRQDAVKPDGSLGKVGSQLRVPGDASLVLPDEAQAKVAEGLIQRAARKHEEGVRTSIEAEAGGFAVYFTWKRPSVRNYNVKDVRDWANRPEVPGDPKAGGGYDLPAEGRVPSDVTQAYRKAHGYKVSE